jgi:uncharacterized membrane protein YfcA
MAVRGDVRRAGIAGAAIGSSIGKLVAGDKLLFLFALAMIVVGVAMLRPRAAEGDPSVSIPGDRRPPGDVVVGAFPGFFGIGGGFLIVPASCSAAACRSSTRSARHYCRSALLD